MEKNRNSLICAALLITALSFTACEKLSSYNYPETATSYNILTADQSFTYFKYIIDRAGMSGAFDGEQELTVFAPTNRAFQQHGYTYDALRSLNVPDLETLVKNHIVPGKIDVVEAGSTVLSAASDFKIELEHINGNHYVDGGDITNPNQEATNGYFNVINTVLSARPTLRHILEKYESGNSDAQLTYLSAAVRRASLVWGDLMDLLDRSGSFYTIFAPNNGAFIDAGYETITDIQSEDPAVLAALLRYQFFEGLNFTTAFSNSPEMAYNGEPIYFDRVKDSEVTFWYANGITFGNNTPSNVLAQNGVVHIVSRLFPAPESTTTLAMIQSRPDLEMFVALISRANDPEDEYDFVEMLSGSDKSFTLFAVNNTGLQQYGFADVAAINNVTPEVLARILKFHLIPNRRNNINVSEGGRLATLLVGEDAATGEEVEHYITFEKENGFGVKGPANQHIIPVLTQNVVTTNGLLNVVGEVLTP